MTRTDMASLLLVVVTVAALVGVVVAVGVLANSVGVTDAEVGVAVDVAVGVAEGVALPGTVVFSPSAPPPQAAMNNETRVKASVFFNWKAPVCNDFSQLLHRGKGVAILRLKIMIQ